GDPQTFAKSVRQALLEIDPAQPVANVRTLREVVAESVTERRFMLCGLAGFAIVALLLAAIGLYGVIAYAVAQRTRELGIRMALGAQRDNILWLVLRQGLNLVLVGVAIGLVGALVLTRFLSGLLFDLKPTDPPTLIATSLLLVAVASLACWVPARRATKVDPMVALRNE
ncbi:MAG TPA: FtsX-like permease family protein, partial [Haliangiales bacterium]|nr:FtsX-like permease family protein [Haliangiales bacterium]